MLFQRSEMLEVMSTLSHKDDYRLQKIDGLPHPLNVWMSLKVITKHTFAYSLTECVRKSH